MLIDSHCHLDQPARHGELDALLQRADDAGVGQLITIGTSTADWHRYEKLAAAHPGKIAYTVGLHPNDAGDDWEEQLMALMSFFAEEPRPVAIGEIGLDFFRLPKYPDERAEIIQRQETALTRQLEFAVQLDCPVVVHSRACFAETVQAIDASGVDWRKVVFHCFSYGPDEVAALNRRGGRASFTGLVTYQNAPAVREALKLQGPDKLMLETDSPYLAPEPHRGKTNEPARVREIAQACANELDLPFDELAALTTGNTRLFFGL